MSKLTHSALEIPAVREPEWCWPVHCDRALRPDTGFNVGLDMDHYSQDLFVLVPAQDDHRFRGGLVRSDYYDGTTKEVTVNPAEVQLHVDDRNLRKPDVWEGVVSVSMTPDQADEVAARLVGMAEMARDENRHLPMTVR